MDATDRSAINASRRMPRSFSLTLVIAVAIFALSAILPFVANDYWVLIGTRAAVYWVLISGLNLIVGFAGQLAIGYVALLTLGAYTASVLASGNVFPPISVLPADVGAALVGAVFGVVVGLPALRLRTFYFAIATLGFATIVRQIALAWDSVTGGGIGIAGPAMPGFLSSSSGLFYLCLFIAAVCTVFTANIARSRFGRSLVAIRDAEVAAEACGINKPMLLVGIFLFTGAVAGVSGGLFASLQTYITPSAFTFELSVLFFVTVLIGGRGSIVGPLIGTIVLTILPEIAAPLAQWSNFLYAVLLLIIVLAAPGGIAALLAFLRGTPTKADGELIPRPATLGAFSNAENGEALTLKDVHLSFGGVRAVDGVEMQVEPGQIHGLIGPNGSGKTTTLNVISGYYRPQQGSLAIGERAVPALQPARRASLGLARTFQTPHIVGEASVLDNVMIGGDAFYKASLVEAMLTLPRARRHEAALRRDTLRALRTVGLESYVDLQADRLKHSELRFLEIARALVLKPRFLLLDEPAAGLSAAEINRLGELVKAIGAHGIGVLLVEHHADLIFDICDRVTVLNLGRVLAQGTADEIRTHEEVVNVYLGG